MTKNRLAPLDHGSTVGIVGGGQLGRMVALSAATLGYKTVVLCQSQEDPAAQITYHTVVADYDDGQALDKFISLADVVTFEFENIPAETLSQLADRILVHPSPEILKIAQDRILEKEFINAVGIETAPWAALDDRHSPTEAFAKIGETGVFKTARFGYDGRGQAVFRKQQELEDIWETAGKPRAVVEAFIEFQCEISVIVARGIDGQIQSYDVVENKHENHILNISIAPARVDKKVADSAVQVAEQVAKSLNLIGLVVVEMFVTSDGSILVNEIAPRPHNSGHWTIDACLTSQFDQLVRAICGLPLGSTHRHSNAEMHNLLADNIKYWPRILEDPANKLHIYGKKETRPGRKMGHVTRLSTLSNDWPNGLYDWGRLIRE